MSQPDRPLLDVVKVVFGTAAGVYAVLQVFNLNDLSQPGGSRDSVFAVGSLAGLVTGWTVCMTLLLTTRGGSKTARLLIDVVKILFGCVAGLFALKLSDNLSRLGEPGYESSASRLLAWGVGGLVVGGGSCLLLFWSAFRRRPKGSGKREGVPPPGERTSG